MIYATAFDPATRQCTAPSAATGFQNFPEARTVMGAPTKTYAAMLFYGDVILTRFPFHTASITNDAERADS